MFPYCLKIVVSLDPKSLKHTYHETFLTQTFSDFVIALRNQLTLYILTWECSGSVVECLTLDRGTAGSSLTGITVLCP